jgi:hypothetical protein
MTISYFKIVDFDSAVFLRSNDFDRLTMISNEKNEEAR